MLFSSHRFGNLTRHADLILYVALLGSRTCDIQADTSCSRYMNDSMIEEAGTHTDLLDRGGSYARIWNLQAQAFI